MTKLTKAEKAARTVYAKVGPSERSKVIRRATSKISAKAQIDFRRDIRR
jgi:hypothetical protein